MKPTESRTDQDDKPKVDGPLSPCHGTQIVNTPVFFWRGHNDYDQFGKTWICMKPLSNDEERATNRDHCLRPVARYSNRTETLFCNKLRPMAFNQNHWDQLKSSGPGYLDEWGFWLIEKNGVLQPYYFHGSRPMQQEMIQVRPFYKVPSHGIERKDALGGNAYQKEEIEDVPF